MSKRSEKKLIDDMVAAGLMFQSATPSQRYTNIWTRSPDRKGEIKPAIRFYVIAPLDSALGKAMNDAAKAKLRKTAVRK